MLGPAQEIVIAGDLSLDSTRDMVRVVHAGFLPIKCCYCTKMVLMAKARSLITLYKRDAFP